MSDADERQLNTDDGNAPQESQKDFLGERFSYRAERIVAYKSPIVPPEVLAQYARIMPDAPERILSMVERQEAHRHHMEKTVVEAGAKNAAQNSSPEDTFERNSGQQTLPGNE